MSADNPKCDQVGVVVAERHEAAYEGTNGVQHRRAAQHPRRASVFAIHGRLEVAGVALRAAIRAVVAQVSVRAEQG